MCHLLTDEQMRRFICDGYLLIDSGLPADAHTAVCHKLQWMLDEGFNPGNNVLPRVPELQKVLDSPAVHGGLSSVLGPDYVLHPHRFCHTNMPAPSTSDAAAPGGQLATFRFWHQDGHSPLARPRHHLPRYAMLLYYPQDTPPELGPTGLIPGSQYSRDLVPSEVARGKQIPGPAGSCVLVHFDVGHGPSINISTDRIRHMVKFVFARVSDPVGPTWDCQSMSWEPPTERETPHDQEVVWRHMWSWLCGEPAVASDPTAAPPADIDTAVADLTTDTPLPKRLQACNLLGRQGLSTAHAVPALVACLDTPDPLRQNAIYALAAIGGAAVPSLIHHLSSAVEPRWNEDAVAFEDSAYALSAIGPTAIPALLPLLESANEWTRLNVLFAVGEMGPRGATPAVLAALRDALRDPSHRIVRTALDAIGQLGPAATPLLGDIGRVLAENHSDWAEGLIRSWSGNDQAHVNAAMALLRLGPDVPGIEQAITDSLGDACGYVDGFGVEALLRLDSDSAIRTAIRHLQSHRWDDTLKKNVRTY